MKRWELYVGGNELFLQSAMAHDVALSRRLLRHLVGQSVAHVGARTRCCVLSDATSADRLATAPSAADSMLADSRPMDTVRRAASRLKAASGDVSQLQHLRCPDRVVVGRGKAS